MKSAGASAREGCHEECRPGCFMVRRGLADRRGGPHGVDGDLLRLHGRHRPDDLRHGDRVVHGLQRFGSPGQLGGAGRVPDGGGVRRLPRRGLRDGQARPRRNLHRGHAGACRDHDGAGGDVRRLGHVLQPVWHVPLGRPGLADGPGVGRHRHRPRQLRPGVRGVLRGGARMHAHRPRGGGHGQEGRGRPLAGPRGRGPSLRLRARAGAPPGPRATRKYAYPRASAVQLRARAQPLPVETWTRRRRSG